jgi:hypothetical protein
MTRRYGQRSVELKMKGKLFNHILEPQVPLRALFQAQAGTLVEPSTFRRPAGWLPHMKDFDPSEDRTYSGEGPVITS